MQFLRKSFLWILLLGAMAFWVYADVTRKGPCEAPLAYTLGSFDSRFDIGKDDFLSALEEASAIWEDASGKDLFAYAPDRKQRADFFKYFIRGPITVNLIYDERQELAEVRRDLVSQIGEVKQSADVVRQQFTALQDKYKKSAAEYQILLDNYKRRHGNYAALEAKRLEVNGLADEVNGLVRQYNYLVNEVNATVQTINQTAGLEFEEGQYISDDDGERIYIFEFGDRNTLVRVLAHELGHAIGLEHNDNPSSIMFYINESKNLSPTKEDSVALAAICKGE